jgi:hypothetical protein
MGRAVVLLCHLTMALPGLALLGCEDDPVAPSTGSIEITTTTSGPVAVSEYTFTVNAGPGQPIGLNSNVFIPNVPAGTNVVQLSQYPAECTVEGGDVRTVRVDPGETAAVTFALTCVAPAS